MTDGGPDDLGERVLVLAPTARDAAASRDLLAGAGVGCLLCATIADVCREAARGIGAAVVTAEAVAGDADRLLAGWLASQPPWSDLPLIVLTPPGTDSPRLLRALEAVGPMTLLKRPVQVSSLVSAVRSALRDRRRQYAVREFLGERERYRVLVTATSDVVYLMSPDWSEMRPLNGRDPAAGTTEPVRSWMEKNLPASEHARVRTAVERAVSTRQTFELEHQVVRADGTSGWALSRAVPILDAAGHVVEWFGTARDVTNQKRAEEELARVTAESERRRRLYETVLSATPDFVYVFSLDHRVLYANDALIEMWGRGRDGAIGKTFLEIGYEPWHAEMHDREIDLVRATKKAIRGEVPFTGTLGRRIYDYIFVPVLGADGEVEAVAGTTRDVTDRKAGEEALRASEGRHRVLAELAAVTRPLTDPAAIMAASARLLAEHLGADRCAYAEVEDEAVYVITGDHARGVPSIVGRWPVAAFGAEHHRMMRANEPYVVSDADADPRIGPGDRPAYQATAIRAVICVPLHKDGRFTAAMAVHQQVPRAWTPDEIDLVTTVVGRCWEALERARVDRALWERDERLQLFLGNATDYAVIISDPDDRVIEWLGGAEAITGWRADEALGQPLEVIFTPEDRAAGVPRAETQKAAAAGRAENTRWHRRKDGSRFFAEGVTVSIRGPGGELRGFGKVFRDATDKKRAEERLSRDAMLLANVHDAVVMTDLDGVVTYWNEGATRLFGWTAGEMVGRPYADRFPEPTRAWVAAEVRARAAGSPWAGEYEDTRKDGSRVWIDARVTTVKDAAGRVAGVLGLSHDVSERKRAEDALREADRKKDEFIALLAHELRNPLAPIRNGLQVLRLSADPAARDRARAMMDRQLAHMVRMIDDLLDVSRIGRHKMELRRGRTTLAEVVASAVETARPAIDAAGHDLTVALPADPIPLDADLTRLAQVFSNLLTNSAKYTPRGGRIWVSAESGGGAVVVSVRDTGIGIPAESLPTIFDMFSQVDRTIERSTGGLGIGLALVKGLVEMHGGTVAAASDGSGRGSTFTVTLPVPADRAWAAPPAAGGGDHARGPGRRILVADDNRDGAESLSDMLRLLGHEVATAHDGLEAVEAAERFRPGVILMDIGMPRLNGLEATRRIRGEAWGRSMTVIALTGWGQEHDRERSRAAGCDGHLVKPVSLPDLEQVLGPAPGASRG